MRCVFIVSDRHVRFRKTVKSHGLQTQIGQIVGTVSTIRLQAANHQIGIQRIASGILGMVPRSDLVERVAHYEEMGNDFESLIFTDNALFNIIFIVFVYILVKTSKGE